MKTLAYYPGCSALGSSKEYETSTQAVCKHLSVVMKEIEDFSCCGSTPAHTMSHELSSALSARNLRLANDMNAEKVLTSCPSCLANLKTAKYRMNDEHFKSEVDALLDTPTTEMPETLSVLQYLVEEVGIEKITEKVKKPLAGLKVACYYGCLLTRPAQIMQFDNQEVPMSMDNILTALGAECVPYPLKTECCGAAHGIPTQEMTAKLSARLLERAKEFDADVVAVACPLCHMNLDLRQGQAEKAVDKKFNLPVLYFTQLMGIAFGFEDKDLQMKKLVVDPSSVFTKIAANTARLEAEAKEKAAKEAEKAAKDAARAAEKAAKEAAKAAEQAAKEADNGGAA